MKKYIYPLLCTIIIVAVAFPVLFWENVEASTIGFRVYNDDGNSVVVETFESEDGICYVFLPSYARMEQVEYCGSEKNVSIDGQALFEGINCGIFELNKNYELMTDESSTICFCRSKSTATLSINTVSGEMENVHNNKYEKESASFLLIDKEGATNCLDEVAMINLRGNYTSRQAKKPYLVTLSEAKDLLGMGAATKWILLANVTDQSNIRNKLVFELAERANLGWVPKCEYVDVYLNGNYNGLYLLAEKVEVGEERLNIDTNSGDFLCRIDFEWRWAEFSNPFKTNNGRTVEITDPKYITEDMKETIINLVNDMEFRIVNEDFGSNIDIDSFVRRYLIDEISANNDADLGSSFFYYMNGMFFAGPIWDYDITFGTNYYNGNPMSFVAKNYVKYGQNKSLYYKALYENDVFYKRITEIYTTEFLPILQDFIDGELYELSKEIASAAELNAIRWGYDIKSHGNQCAQILAYLKDRVAFLNSAWIDNVEYCTVRFDINNSEMYWNASINKGDALGEIPDYVKSVYCEKQNVEWVNKDTGETFDLTAPVYEDVILVEKENLNKSQHDQNKELSNQTTFATREYITAFSIAGVLLLLGCFAVVEIWRSRRGDANNV